MASGQADDLLAAMHTSSSLHEALRTGIGTYIFLYGNPLRLATFIWMMTVRKLTVTE